MTTESVQIGDLVEILPAERPVGQPAPPRRYGRVLDTQYRLVSREEVYTVRESHGYYGVAPNPNPFGWNGYYDQRPAPYQGYYDNTPNQGYYDNNGRYVPPPRDSRPPGQYYGQSAPPGRAQDPRGQDPRGQAPRDPFGREYQTPQRIDPGYLWGNRRYY